MTKCFGIHLELAWLKSLLLLLLYVNELKFIVWFCLLQQLPSHEVVWQWTREEWKKCQIALDKEREREYVQKVKDQ